MGEKKNILIIDDIVDTSGDVNPLDVYTKVLAKVWEDGVLTVEEREFLELMREKMHIPQDVHNQLETGVLQHNTSLYECVCSLENTKNNLEKEYRRRYPMRFRAKDGHLVRTELEMRVDDMLFGAHDASRESRVGENGRGVLL